MAQRTLEFMAATTDPQAALAIGRDEGGWVYVDERPESDERPFRALLTLITDSIPRVREIADRGLYVVCRRVIKPGESRVAGLYPLVRKPGLDHEAADAHWRDVHAPLALEHHAYMTHYSQLSVVARLHGPELDGIAVVCFDSLEDLRNRFYTREESRAVIADDVRRFADIRHSPKPLVTRPYRFDPS